MTDGSILEFAQSFMNRLNKLREFLRKNGYNPSEPDYTSFRRRLKKYNVDLKGEIELDLGVLKDDVVKNLYKRRVLKEAQKYAFEKVFEITRENGDTRSIEGLDKVMFFNLPTGSGKTLIYTLIGYYYVLRGLIETRKVPKFVIATRTNLEGGQVLSTLYAVRLALKLFDVLLNDPVRINGKPVTKDVVDKIIITNYRGASNVPCIAKAYDTNFTHAVPSRKKCSNYRKSKKCPYVDEIVNTKLYRVISLGSDEDPHEVVKDLFENACPLYSTALASALAHFVVTNHATLKRIAAGVQGAPTFVLVSWETYVGNEIDDLVAFLTAGLADSSKVLREYQDNLRIRIERHLPYDTVIIIDEADNFLGNIHKIEEKSVKFYLPLRNAINYPKRREVLSRASDLFDALNRDELSSKFISRLKDELNEGRIGEFLKKVEVKDEKSRRGRRSKKNDEKFSPSVFNALFHLRIVTLLDRIVMLSPGLARLIVPKIIRAKEGRRVGYKGNAMELAVYGRNDEEFIRYVAHYIFAPYDNPNNYDILLKALNELEGVAHEEGLREIVENLSRVAREQLLEGDRYYTAKNLIKNIRLPEVTEDDALYIKITTGSFRDSVSVSLVRYQDVIEALENLMRRRLMFFSATNDFLYIYTLMIPLRELRIKLEEDNPRSLRSIIIYNGLRENEPNVFVYHEEIKKNNLPYMFPQALKEFGIGSRVPRPFMLVLVPANDDIDVVEKALKDIYSGRANVVKLSSSTGYEGQEEIMIKTVEDVIKRIRKIIKEAEDSEKSDTLLNIFIGTYTKEIEKARKELEAIKGQIYKNFYNSFIEPIIRERNGKKLKEMNSKGYPKKRIKFLLSLYEIVHEATLIKYVLEEHKRFVSRSDLQRKVREGRPFVAVGTGAFARGFDFPRLNSVVVARLTFIPPDLQTKNDIHRMRRTDSRQTKQIVEEVLDDDIKNSILNLTGGKKDDKKNREEEESTENYVERYASVSYAAISGIQAMGRLTRGEGEKIAFIADGRFRKKGQNVLGALDVLAEVNRRMILRMRKEGVKVFMYTRDKGIVGENEYADYDLRHVLKITKVMDKRVYKRTGRRSLSFLNF